MVHNKQNFGALLQSILATIKQKTLKPTAGVLQVWCRYFASKMLIVAGMHYRVLKKFQRNNSAISHIC